MVRALMTSAMLVHGGGLTTEGRLLFETERELEIDALISNAGFRIDRLTLKKCCRQRRTSKLRPGHRLFFYAT